MHQPPPTDAASEAFWREFLTEGHRGERAARRFLKHIPSAPRCKACAAPFAGPGAPVMRLLRKPQSHQNPNLCAGCFRFMERHRGGAEIEVTLLFADVRNSTALAERMSATEFRALLDRFYRLATDVVFANDGSVDKFVGDEVMAMFFPLASGEAHAAKALATARQLLRDTGNDGPAPWLPMGAGVHTGPAWVGAIGDDRFVELTAIGDTVNVTARLAAAALQGEILATPAALEHAGLSSAGLERRSLELKGKSAPTEVLLVR